MKPLQQSLYVFVATIAVSSPQDAAAQAPSPAPVSTPGTGVTAFCPTVEATLDSTLDTKKVVPGDVFRFTTDAPVTFESQTLPQGTPGAGFIAVMDHSKSQGHAGYLVLDARFLAPPGGPHVPARLAPGTDGESFAFVGAGNSFAPGILGYIPYYVGTAAGVYNFFHHGKDAAVIAGTKLSLVLGDGIEMGTCAPDVTRPGSNKPRPRF